MRSTTSRNKVILLFGLTALTLAFLANGTLAQQGNASGTWSGTGASVGCSNTSPANCQSNQFPLTIVIVHVGNTLTATLPEAGLTLQGFLVGESEQTLFFSLKATFVASDRPCTPGQLVGSGDVNLAENTFQITVVGINDSCSAETTRLMLQRVG